ncbi:MAG: SMC-Scp complex subunit ScpB, partial [Candidatus Parabeggiatoa sp.]|nr:SMC-Scp complex subunit ScpB [Candidatus Parabeggiatoa sp.]
MPPLKLIIEAALFAADRPLTLDHLVDLFTGPEQPERSLIRAALRELREDYSERGIELMQIASGYRFQTQQSMIPWLKRLQPERAPRYSRALLETIAIIAYRQPITRSDIEKIRGISVSTDLIKRLLDYNWIRILAHRDSPGRPALYGTTRSFLDYFNLKNLSDLPTLIELQEMALPTDIFESEGPEEDEETLETKDNEDSDTEALESKEKPIQVITEGVETTSNDTPPSEAPPINVDVEKLENEMEEKEDKTDTTEEEIETETTEIKHTADAKELETPQTTAPEESEEKETNRNPTT